MTKIRNWALRKAVELKTRKDEEAQGLVEYALIIVLVSIASIIALTALGVQVSAVFDNITAELSV